MRTTCIPAVLTLLAAACGEPVGGGTMSAPAAIAGAPRAPEGIAPAELPPPTVAVIAGYVYDFVTGASLVGASVSTVPASAEVTTGEGGAFVIDSGLDGGTAYEVHAAADGYGDNHITVQAQVGIVRVADIGLTRLAPVLGVDPLTLDLGAVTATASFDITNSGPPGVELLWEVTAPPAWISSVTPSSGVLGGGAAPASVALEIDRSVLGEAYGPRSALVAVSSNGGVAMVDVRIMHLDQDAPHLAHADGIVEFGVTEETIDVTLTNDGTGSLEWSVAEALTWLSVAPPSGQIAAGQSQDVTLTADRDGLAAGSEHAGFVAFDSNTTIDDTIPLRVHVAAPHHWEWGVAPTAIDFGSELVDGQVIIENRSSDSLDFTVSNAEDWLEFLPSAGRVAPGESVAAFVLLDRAEIPDGAFSGTSTLSSLAGDVTITGSGTNVTHPRLRNRFLELNVDYSGQPDPSVEFWISNSGSGSLEWTVSSTTPWVTAIEPPSGTSVNVNCQHYDGSCGEKIRVHVDPWLLPAAEDATGEVVLDVAATGDHQVMPLNFKFASDFYWEKLTTPPELGARADMGLVYDEVRDRVVLFGGAADDASTWEFDGSAWAEVATASAPDPTLMTAMAYDRRRGNVVWVGRHVFFEPYDHPATWVYDGTDWTLAVGYNEGTPAYPAHLRFDADAGGVAALGRYDHHDDHWRFVLFDGAAWQALGDPAAVLPVEARAFFRWQGKDWLQQWYSDRNRLYETVAYATDAAGDWQEVEPLEGLYASQAHLPPIVADAQDDRLYSVSGWRDEPHFWQGHTPDAFVRVYRPGETEPAEHLIWADPPKRWGHGMVYDSKRHRLVMVGGNCFTGYFSDPAECIDTWAINLARPTQEYSETPVLALSTNALDFGTATDALTLNVENSGDGVLDWIAPPPAGVAVAPDWGETAGGATTELTISVDRVALGVGVHQLTLSVKSDGGNEDVTIDVTVE